MLPSDALVCEMGPMIPPPSGGRETPVTRGRVCPSPEPAWMRAWPLFVRPRIAQSQNGPPRPRIFGRIRPAKTAAPRVAHSDRSCPALQSLHTSPPRGCPTIPTFLSSGLGSASCLQANIFQSLHLLINDRVPSNILSA